MRYFITFSYNGSYFNGYQRQKNLKTVQESIENVLSKIENRKVDIHASGRTDKKVHALNQTAHFDLKNDITPDKLMYILNNALEGEIYIKNIQIVDNKFHARYNVKTKTYKYIINVGEYNPIEKDYVYQYNKSLNIMKMRKALLVLRGEHDFRAFCSNQKERENCVRKIISTSIIKRKNKIIISIKGNGFLRKMVRNIVGVLIEISEGKKDINYIYKLLEEKEKKYNIKPVDPSGLYLYDVEYKK